MAAAAKHKETIRVFHGFHFSILFGASLSHRSFLNTAAQAKSLKIFIKLFKTGLFMGIIWGSPDGICVLE